MTVTMINPEKMENMGIDNKEQGKATTSFNLQMSASRFIPFSIPAMDRPLLACCGSTNFQVTGKSLFLFLSAIVLVTFLGLVVSSFIFKMEIQDLRREHRMLERKLNCFITAFSGDGESDGCEDVAALLKFEEENDEFADASREKRSLLNEVISSGTDNPRNLVSSRPGMKKANRRGEYWKKFLQNRRSISKLKLKLSLVKKRLNSAIKAAYENHATNQSERKTLFLNLLNRHQNQLVRPSELKPERKRNTQFIFLGTRNAFKSYALEVIGPWVPAHDEGPMIGFNAPWYDGIELDGSTLVFKESGLFLIYAQLLYRNSECPACRLGFKMLLKKQPKNFRKPAVIAECVGAYAPTGNTGQTCFTQVCWHFDKGDKLYLEQSFNSTPFIEGSGNTGQTFMGVVPLFL